MRLQLILASLILGSTFLASCEKDPESSGSGALLIDTVGRFEKSNLAGNLMATAIKQETQVDIVFYPSIFLEADKYAIIDSDLTPEIIEERILPLYPNTSEKDQFQVGTLRGSQIREFVINRTLENYRLDMQTAGLEYDIQFIGGLPTIYQINLTHGIPLEDDRYYRVAISDYYYYNSATFPGYRYRNNFEQRFLREAEMYSARESLTKFLTGFKTLPLLDEPRALIRTRTRGIYPRALSISEIQGISHVSPYYGYRALTKGILTAVSRPENGIGMELYLQMPDSEDDGDIRTSSAINVYLSTQRSDLVVGQELEIGGLITEIMTYQGMTRTAIREVDSLRIISSDNPLPAFKIVGSKTAESLRIPTKAISTYRGNLNEKKELLLTDAIDFWESLEGMRIKVETPTVVGFRGGLEKFDERKSYITVYVKPEGSTDPALESNVGAPIPDPIAKYHNPEVIRIVDSDLAPNVRATNVFNVGDKFSYDLEGIMSYQTNVFGDGEFVLFVTGDFNGTSSIKSLENRPQTRLMADEDHLTVAAFNVENLAGNRLTRLQEIAKAISINLKCPDIVVLPEIQDFNGPVMSGGSSAEQTLIGLMGYLNCTDKAYYRALNVDPVSMQDGGEPGGNIRVSMIFNSRRVGFESRGAATAYDETTIDANGNFNQNPGRIYPNDPVFNRSRKPLGAQFTFKGEKVTVIGTHFNSKLGDGNLWGATQPLDFASEDQRSLIAKKINQFVGRLVANDPTMNVIVAGDMNAYWNEASLKVLEGKTLVNLMTHASLLHNNRWYTTNYNGGAGAIDHMFVNGRLLEKSPEYEIIHINSIFMNKVSDHDPLIGRFKF